MLRLLLKGLLRLVFRLVYRVRVHGDPEIRAERLLIVANHESFLDELLLCLFLPQRPVIVIYASSAHKRLLRFLTRQLVDFLPIDPNNPMELKSVIRLLETGRPVLMFPEGRITTTGNLMKTYDGPGFIASKAGATILPVRIEGAARSRFSLLQGNFQRSVCPRIRLFVREPTRIDTHKATHGEQHDLAAQSMHRVMTDLMFAGRAEQTLFAALVEAARLQGRNWRLLGDVERVDHSYNDLLRTALILGRLIAGKIPEERRIGVLLPNNATQLALIFGLTAWRRIPAVLNPGADAAMLTAACRAAGLRQVICSRSLLAQPGMEARVEALGGVELLYLEDLHRQVGITDHLWWALWARHQPLRVLPPTRPDEAALLMFTTGSSGSCRGVQLSHRAILANVSQLRSVLDFSVNDVILSALPLSSPFGLTCGGLIPLLCGARVFLHSSPNQSRVLPEMSYTAPCTIVFGTNTFLKLYGTQARPFDLHRLRYAIAGVERITEEVRQLWFEKFGVRIFEGYGTTETAPVISINTQMAFRSGSVGQLLPSIRYRLAPLAGVRARHGGMCGQLHVLGPNLMDGHFEAARPEVLVPPHSALGPGWHDTGDIVEIDAEGFVFLRGRIRRMIRVGESALALGVLEMMLNEACAPAVHALIPGETDGETKWLHVFVAGAAPGAAELAGIMASACVGGPLPEIRVSALERLPRQADGCRIDYAALKRTLGD